MLSGICFNLDQSKILSSGNELTLYHTIPSLPTPKKKAFENIVGKGDNTGKQHFVLFPQCFLLVRRQISFFESHLFCCLQMLSIWTSLKS